MDPAISCGYGFRSSKKNYAGLNFSDAGCIRKQGVVRYILQCDDSLIMRVAMPGEYM